MTYHFPLKVHVNGHIKVIYEEKAATHKMLTILLSGKSKNQNYIYAMFTT